MSTPYKKKVEECWEIIDKGVFDDWQRNFIRDLRRRLRISSESLLSPFQKVKIDECYDVACSSPY